MRFSGSTMDRNPLHAAVCYDHLPLHCCLITTHGGDIHVRDAVSRQDGGCPVPGRGAPRILEVEESRGIDGTTPSTPPGMERGE